MKLSPSPEPGPSRRTHNLDAVASELPQQIRDELRGEGSEKGRSRSRRESRERSKRQPRGSSTSPRRGQKRPRSPSRRRGTGASRKETTEKDLSWKAGEGKYGLLKVDTKKEQKFEQQVFVGGMKNPAEVVEGMPTLQNLGRRIMGAWERHCNHYPHCLKVAETYGTPECVLEEKWVKKWKEELKKLTGAKGAPTLKLKGKWNYTSPLDQNLYEAWGKRGNDPEVEVPKWIESGVPLGINCSIKSCNIFPPALKQDSPMRQDDWQAAQSLREDIGNYTSVREQEADAKVEIDRLVEQGYAIPIEKTEAEEAGFKGVTVSRLGLIVKTKEDGSKKRRIIIDLRRSGGNSKAVLPERLILPRPADAIAMLRKMHALRADKPTPQERTMEMVLIDVSDAFMHLAIAEEEKGHCLTPALDSQHWLLFVALLFGYKTAPLTWSRVAAMTARLIQSIIPAEKGMHQVYLDDSLWVLCGRLATRNRTLGCILTTMAALGLRLSLKKGERSADVTWIGVKFKLVAPDYDYLMVTLPERFIDELCKQLEAWDRKGMIGVNELRQAAGRVAWLAGVLPRARWVTSTLYAVLYSHEADQASGIEAGRRAKRQDDRPKDHLVPVKEWKGQDYGS